MSLKHDRPYSLMLVGLYVVFSGVWIFLSDFLWKILDWSIGHFLVDAAFLVLTSLVLYKMVAGCLENRSQLEEKLRTNEERLRMALSASRMGVWDWDLRTNAVFWSPECHDIVGLKDFNGTFEAFADLLHPDDAAHVMETVEKALAQKSTYVDQFRIIRPDGKERWLSNLGRAAYNANGVPVQLIGTVQDITERKMADEAIRKYAIEVQDLYNNAPCGYHSLDANGVYARINDTELKWLGYDRDEIIGKKSFADLIPPDSKATFSSNFARFKERGSVEGLEYVMIRKDGTRLPVLLSATIVRDERGNYVMSRGVLLDMTERKSAQETMRRYAHRLIEMEEELRKKLAADLHDEIGRDLTALGLNIAILHDNLPTDVREKLAARLDDSRTMLETISRTVRDLMSELRPPVLDDYGLPAALRWHAELFSKRTSIAVDLAIGDNLARMSTDKELALFRIAQESLTNASKHANAHNIKLSLTEVDAKVRLSISDDGAGFDAARACQKMDGSCWGLTIMRERAEAANGVFQLDSAPGRGTRILVEVKRSA